MVVVPWMKMVVVGLVWSEQLVKYPSWSILPCAAIGPVCVVAVPVVVGVSAVAGEAAGSMD